MSLFEVILPELILIVVACALFLVGAVNKRIARVVSAWVALAAVAGVFILQFVFPSQEGSDGYGAFRVFGMAQYVKLLSSGVGVLFVLMAWPTDRDATGNSAVNFGTEAGEFFALMLLSIAGVFVVAGANDLILLFLGIELASIPTYIMVSVSRPLPAAQEAGVKYFFLGAMSAALMLFGFSYLYGTTGLTSLSGITDYFSVVVVRSGGISAAASGAAMTSWQMLAVVLLIAGFAFKMAAVPLHFYAGDVYQGAATPVTALLSFVPKASGFVALLKVLFAVGAGSWAVPEPLARLIWVLAVLTMTVGNVLGLLQQNVKRVLAYSSVAHSGYLLVGVATLVAPASATETQTAALQAILFYLTAYGIMNAAAFGVLMLLPAKPLPSWDKRPSTGSAETFDDIAGAGIDNVGLGLAMAVACFSLTGLPLTIGFFGKLYLIQSAWRGGLTWLVVIMMINAAISAGYYLRIVGTMFLRPEPVGGMDLEPASGGAARAGTLDYAGATTPIHHRRPVPIVAAVVISSILTVLFGVLWPATEELNTRVAASAVVDRPVSPTSVSDASGVTGKAD